MLITPVNDPSPLLIIRATEWAEQQSLFILGTGNPLNADEIALASSVGVVNPEHIRIVTIEQIPFPDDTQLLNMATNAGLLTSNLAGLTLGYGIFIRNNHYTARLLSHEFRHVYQYEQAGTMSAFLADYLHQIVRYGYEAAPLEEDARIHEVREPQRL